MGVRMEEAAPSPGMQPWEAGAAPVDAFSLSQSHRKAWVENNLKEHLVPTPTQGHWVLQGLAPALFSFHRLL